MKAGFFSRTIIFCVLFFSFAGLEARYLTNSAPLVLPKYKLINLGSTVHDKRVLNAHCWPLSLGPKINNSGQVIGNRGCSSFLWKKCSGFFDIDNPGCITSLVSINNNSAIIGRHMGCDGVAKWFSWNLSSCGKEPAPAYFDFGCIQGEEIFLRQINDNGYLIGAQRLKGNSYRSVYFDRKKNMKALSSGVLLGINNYNTMMGSESCGKTTGPFLSNFNGSISIIGDDCTVSKPSGIYKFGYPILTQDNAVYGTFRGKKEGKPYLFAYLWNDEDQIFRTLDLKEMQISSLNRSHILVGSQSGEAVVCVNHGKPEKLPDMIVNSTRGWKFLEATDINDTGQIVGYGMYKGNMTLFMLDPVD